MPRPSSPSAVLLSALVAVALATAACGAPAPSQQSTLTDVSTTPAADPSLTAQSPSAQSPSARPSQSASASASPGAADTTISEADAQRIAEEAVGGGTAVASRPDTDDGRPEWEVIVQGDDGAIYDVTIDAADGTVRDFDREDDGGTAGGEPTVTQAEAEQRAVEAVGGGDAVASHLDSDDGRREWEVIVLGDDGFYYDVTIDATDGTVREVDRED